MATNTGRSTVNVKVKVLSSVTHSRQLELTAELDLLATLLHEMDAREVWLFGSLVRGEVHEGSDLDLLVVMDSALPFVERLAHFYCKLKPEVATDPFVYTPEEIGICKREGVCEA